MIYKQIDIRIIKFDFSTISVAYLWLLIFSENNYFSGNVFFPPGEFTIIIEEGKLQNCKKSKSISIKSIKRIFFDLALVFADRYKKKSTSLGKKWSKIRINTEFH